MNTIIISTNFSDGAKNAAKFAINLFRDVNTKYFLVNTYYEPPSTYDIVSAPDGALKTSSENNLEKEKKWLLNEFPDWKLDIEIKAVYGTLLKGLNETVKEVKADFVTISNRVKFDLDSLIMRQKTADIVHKINCTIISVPDFLPFSKMKSIAFASDLKLMKDTSTLDPLKRLLKIHKSKIKLFHVNTKKQNDIEFEKTPAGIQFSGYFADFQHSFDVYRNPDIGAGLSEYTKNEECSILVVIERKHSFFERLFERSKSKEAAKLSQVPMMILKEV